MCGNGLRVFVRFLLEENLVAGDVVEIATRVGLRRATVERDGRISVDLGQPSRDLEAVSVGLGDQVWSGHAVSVGNPHCVVQLDRVDQLAQLDLTRAPELAAAQFPDGGNVEWVVPVAPGQLRMRVWERGVGETMSCGTGAVAAVVDSLAQSGAVDGRYQVDLPGGRLEVRISPDGQASLCGPAVIVARGEVLMPSD
jgi:diaminopimelate epimerase